MMNYIKLINNFWDKDIEYGFSPITTKMYFTLLDTCNRLGWKNPFKLTNSRLSHVVKCTENSIINSRISLAKADLISFKKGYKSKCCIYYLKGNKTTYNKGQFRDDLDKQFSNTCDNSSEVLIDVCDNHLDKHCDILKTKLNNTKQNKRENTDTNTGEKFKNNIPYNEIIKLFNNICSSFLPEIRSLSLTNLKNIQARWREHSHIDQWAEAFRKIEESDFLRGKSGKWKASFEWLIGTDDHFNQVLKGNYSNVNKKMDMQKLLEWAKNDKGSIDLWNNDFVKGL